MKKYCLDMSGFSNPIQSLPDDIHVSLWNQICDRVRQGIFATTTEVYEELTHINGAVGQCLKDHMTETRLEVGSGNWNYDGYIKNFQRLHPKYQKFITGTGGSKASLSMADFSVVILGKTLALPVISMEISCAHNLHTRSCKIPDVCSAEGVLHMTFNDFLRSEGITA